MTELRPCPFCGSDRLLHTGGARVWVSCIACYGEGPVLRDKSAASEAWNRRPDVAAIVAWLRTGPQSTAWSRVGQAMTPTEIADAIERGDHTKKRTDV